MLPQALMLAATWITVPEEGTVDAAGEDAEGADEKADAEDIGDEEELTEAEAASVEVAVAGELPTEGAAVLDEPQALSPTARTTAAAGRKMDRRNITELSNFEVSKTRNKDPTKAVSGVMAGVDRAAKLTP